MKRIIAALALCATLAGCAMPTPVVDPKYVGSQEAYRSDLYDCQTIAYRAVPDPVVQAIAGVVIDGLAGAAGGAAGGAIFGNAGQGAALGSVIGGGYGGISTGADAQSTRKQIVGNCLAHRGYAVLAMQ
jgi:hypothetical protein